MSENAEHVEDPADFADFADLGRFNLTDFEDPLSCLLFLRVPDPLDLCSDLALDLLCDLRVLVDDFEGGGG